MDYRAKAKGYFEEGYNCCQAVLLTFCEDLQMEKETALRLAASFGGGMGGLREVCGAASGMFMAIGLQQGYTLPNDPEGKQAHYRRIQELAEEFEAENGSIICRELLGAAEAAKKTPQARTAEYYKKRPCGDLVGYAAEIAAKKMGL